ncbi:GntR family transcriptional regulator [Deinobacterium chartae]|uniref:GntR family transcriptional regulator n=1 Tax=Deinobacterium chartae TaxID=521158 RepID=A0A841I7M9_9DEIO|nr:GntR family transcriptional regulator [Deinobacterium chartae]MBB6099815.1 GntR family transcriptional regulator [Deinobacterium chartae]
MTPQQLENFQTVLDSSSSAPMYLQVSQGLQRLIQQNTFPQGSALPGERDLAAMLGVSRVTVRQALRLLEEQGYLIRRQGSGTFVAPRRIVQPLSALTGFSEDMRSRGLTPGGRVLSLERTRPSPQEAMNLGVSPSSEVLRLRRLRTADAVPLAIETSTLPLELVGPLTIPEVENRSLYSRLRERGLEPDRALQHLRATAADLEAAELLDVEIGSALLATERVTWAASGRTLEYARSLYRGDRYDFIVQLTH